MPSYILTLYTLSNGVGGLVQGSKGEGYEKKREKILLSLPHSGKKISLLGHPSYSVNDPQVRVLDF